MTKPSKYIATLTNGRGEVSARNMKQLQDSLCQQLKVDDKILTYHLIRSAALNTLQDRSRILLTHIGIESVKQTYKSVASDSK